MIGLLPLNHFYPVYIVPTSSKGKESDELLCTARSLVMVREPSCQRKGVNGSSLVHGFLGCSIIPRLARRLPRWQAVPRCTSADSERCQVSTAR